MLYRARSKQSIAETLDCKNPLVFQRARTISLAHTKLCAGSTLYWLDLRAAMAFCICKNNYGNSEDRWPGLTPRGWAASATRRCFYS